MYRQNGRYRNIESTTMNPSIESFSAVSSPAAEARLSFMLISGMPPSSIPLGQMYLQNHGSAFTSSGRQITIIIRKAYLK